MNQVNIPGRSPPLPILDSWALKVIDCGLGLYYARTNARSIDPLQTICEQEGIDLFVAFLKYSL